MTLMHVNPDCQGCLLMGQSRRQKASQPSTHHVMITMKMSYHFGHGIDVLRTLRRILSPMLTGRLPQSLIRDMIQLLLCPRQAAVAAASIFGPVTPARCDLTRA